jgi:hypothetical protein
MAVICAPAASARHWISQLCRGVASGLQQHGISTGPAGVGANLQDHLQIHRSDSAPPGSKAGASLNTMAQSMLEQGANRAECALKRGGPMSMATSQLEAPSRSSPDQPY